MLDQERDFVSSNFKHGTGSLDVVRPISKTRIEKSGVVNAELAIGRIERNHLRCVIRRYAHSFPRRKNIKISRLED